MPRTTLDDLALANRFQVVMDGAIDLGYWSSVQGLDVAWTPCEYRAGDAGNSRLYYPGATKYSDVQLQRAACTDSQTVQSWLKGCSMSVQKFSGTIYLGNTESNAVITWTLMNVMPIKWTIEKFDASASKVALETLTLAHEGFLGDDVTFVTAVKDKQTQGSAAQGFGDTPPPATT